MINLFKLTKIIISDKFHYKVFILLFFTIVAVFLETLGIALILPALTIISNQNFNSEITFLNTLMNKIFLNSSGQEIIINIIGFIVLVYFVKNVFLFLFIWWQKTFADSLYKDLCKKLIKNYTSLDYISFINLNTSILARYFEEIKGFIKFIDNSIVLFVECLVLFGILFVLLIFEPFATIVIFSTVAFISFIYKHLTKKHIDNLGKARFKQSTLSIKSLLHILNNFKIIKVLGREEGLTNKYLEHNVKYSGVKKIFDILDNSTKLWLEFLGVCGLCMLILILSNENNLGKIIPTVGLFAAASFRILPSITRILRSFQAINFSRPIVYTLATELKNSENFLKHENLDNKIDFEKNILLDKITFKYPSKDKILFNNINLEINKLDILGLVGETGSGKSTLIDLIIGVLKPTGGKIYVDKKDINNDYKSWQNIIGYVPQNVQLIDDTIKNNIVFGLNKENYKDTDLHKYIKICQLSKLVENLKLGIETNVGDKGVKLSGGQIQRIGIARALLNKPSVLILDEASNSLDVETEQKLLNSIRENLKKITILMISHRDASLNMCNKIIKISNQGIEFIKNE